MSCSEVVIVIIPFHFNYKLYCLFRQSKYFSI
nr:MAG TPA: hypothetical protein [Bacteriophage sp.]